jgi:hypothetical protein
MSIKEIFKPQNIVVIVTVGILIYGIGCQSTTPSLQKPEIMKNRGEIQQEALVTQKAFLERKAKLDVDIARYNSDFELFSKKLELAKADLDYKDQPKAELFKVAGSLLTQWASGGVPLSGIIGALVTAAGIFFGFKGTADASQKTQTMQKINAQLHALSTAEQNRIVTLMHAAGGAAPQPPDIKAKLDEMIKIIEKEI